jgi:hypothetical protein
MVDPSAETKALLVATLAAGNLASAFQQEAFDCEPSGMSFEEWCEDRAFIQAKRIMAAIG